MRAIVARHFAGRWLQGVSKCLRVSFLARLAHELVVGGIVRVAKHVLMLLILGHSGVVLVDIHDVLDLRDLLLDVLADHLALCHPPGAATIIDCCRWTYDYHRFGDGACP